MDEENAVDVDPSRDSVTPPRQPIVVMEGVNKHFGDLHVLKDINLTVGKGDVVVVLGPSGSGKSTLCRTINRLETFESGRILIDGQPLPEEGKALAGLRADVGMVFQSFNLFAHKTILQNVTLGPIKARGVAKADAERIARQVIGVRDVRNLITVVAPPLQPAMKDQNEAVQENVVLALQGDRALANTGIRVESADAGVVVLGGTA